MGGGGGGGLTAARRYKTKTSCWGWKACDRTAVLCLPGRVALSAAFAGTPAGK